MNPPSRPADGHPGPPPGPPTGSAGRHAPERPFSYAPDDVGATAPGAGRVLAGRYTTRLRVTTRLGSGEAVFLAASRALLEWRMHRAMGVTLSTEAARARPGAPVTVGIGVGPLRVRGPCRVVWTLDGERSAGWAYGTLDGHPERGEEAFLVSLADDGTVRLTVTAFSSPALWWTRATEPAVRLFQQLYAHHCGRTLRRLVRDR